MLGNIKISEGVVIGIVTAMGALYGAFLCMFVTQLRDIVVGAERRLVVALEGFRELLKRAEVGREAVEVYSDVVEAYQTYKSVQRAANAKLIIFSTVGAALLLAASMLVVGYSKLLAIILMGLLFMHTVVMVVGWLMSLVKSGTTIVRFGKKESENKSGAHGESEEKDK